MARRSQVQAERCAYILKLVHRSQVLGFILAAGDSRMFVFASPSVRSCVAFLARDAFFVQKNRLRHQELFTPKKCAPSAKKDRPQLFSSAFPQFAKRSVRGKNLRSSLRGKQKPRKKRRDSRGARTQPRSQRFGVGRSCQTVLARSREERPTGGAKPSARARGRLCFASPSAARWEQSATSPTICSTMASGSGFFQIQGRRRRGRRGAAQCRPKFFCPVRG